VNIYEYRVNGFARNLERKYRYGKYADQSACLSGQINFRWRGPAFMNSHCCVGGIAHVFFYVQNCELDSRQCLFMPSIFSFFSHVQRICRAHNILQAHNIWGARHSLRVYVCLEESGFICCLIVPVREPIRANLAKFGNACGTICTLGCDFESHVEGCYLGLGSSKRRTICYIPAPFFSLNIFVNGKVLWIVHFVVMTAFSPRNVVVLLLQEYQFYRISSVCDEEIRWRT